MSSAPIPPNPAPIALSRRSELPIAVLVAAAVLLAAIGFGVGYLVGDHGSGSRRVIVMPGRERTGAIPGVGMMPGGGFPGTNGSLPTPGTNPNGTPFGEVLGGTVTKVQGSSLVLHTFRGQTVTVHTSSSTFVRLAGGAGLADLSPGSVVFVTGTPSSDGSSIAATRVLGGFTQPTTNQPSPNG